MRASSPPIVTSAPIACMGSHMSELPSVPIRILVVEDEFLIRLTLTEALSDEGFEVLEAETGDAALPMLAAASGIRLLLTDIQLPGSPEWLCLGKARAAGDVGPASDLHDWTARPQRCIAAIAAGCVHLKAIYPHRHLCGGKAADGCAHHHRRLTAGNRVRFRHNGTRATRIAYGALPGNRARVPARAASTAASASSRSIRCSATSRSAACRTAIG